MEYLLRALHWGYRREPVRYVCSCGNGWSLNKMAKGKLGGPSPTVGAQQASKLNTMPFGITKRRIILVETRWRFPWAEYNNRLDAVGHLLTQILLQMNYPLNGNQCPSSPPTSAPGTTVLPLARAHHLSGFDLSSLLLSSKWPRSCLSLKCFQFFHHGHHPIYFT